MKLARLSLEANKHEGWNGAHNKMNNFEGQMKGINVKFSSTVINQFI